MFNYIFELFDMTINIVTKASDIELIKTLDLTILKQDKWEKSAQYAFSRFKRHTPFRKEVDDLFVISNSPIPHFPLYFLNLPFLLVKSNAHKNNFLGTVIIGMSVFFRFDLL